MRGKKFAGSTGGLWWHRGISTKALLLHLSSYPNFRSASSLSVIPLCSFNMKATTTSALFGAAVLAALPSNAAPTQGKFPIQIKRDVDLRYPYTGPEIPIGDWVDATVNGNGKGFIRLVEPPAVPGK